MGEKWNPVTGYEGLYAVSDKGHVIRTNKYRNSTGRPLRPSVVSGYHRVTLSKENTRKAMLVHRLVADAFIGITSGFDVNHLNGDRLDNRLENLEVVTRRDNERHKWATLKTGALNNIKLCADEVLEIRRLYASGQSLSSLAKRFGVGKSNISAIVNRHTWKHI